MILVDANLLVYAHVSSTPEHAKARAWLDGCLNGVAPVGLPWASLLGFLRLVTNPRIFRRPARASEAWAQVESWLDTDTAWIPQPTERHREIFGALMGRPFVQANLVPDAHLAALATEHGLLLCSSDADFAKFKGLRWENPIA